MQHRSDISCPWYFWCQSCPNMVLAMKFLIQRSSLGILALYACLFACVYVCLCGCIQVSVIVSCECRIWRHRHCRKLWVQHWTNSWLLQPALGKQQHMYMLADISWACFRELLPIPHRARLSSTRAVRKKPPTPELTSDESLTFVTEVLEKQRKKQPQAAKPDKQTQIGQKRKKGKLGGSAENDHEPCVMCKVAYGDASDPKKKDNWETCKRCKRWWHETCTALSGSYDKRNVFSCDQCVSQKRNKKT